ncbi:MAG: hypothetical protein U5L95_02195 [Candidatus Saccharibacteria bacterium]|nr:hypothetical protein [Candidatus Saccharibacteria bacterium]
MFGNSKNNDAQQQNDLQDFGEPQPQNNGGAPDLPTMGGQNSPFQPATQQPVDANPAPATTDAQQPDAPQDNIPHHEDTEHMVTDHGTPDPAPQAEDEPAPSGNLVEIKQQALSQLSPLVSHLDQTAEEKFRTTMMMIQATDDQSLLKEAYEAAQKIENDKARAQALLDVINEINYFTQQQKS